MHPPLEVHQHPTCKEVRARRAGCTPCRCERRLAKRTEECACPRALEAPRSGPPLPPPPDRRCRRSARPRRAPQQILALKQCHRDNPWAKYWGVCNQVAKDLNSCFKGEKVAKR